MPKSKPNESPTAWITNTLNNIERELVQFEGRKQREFENEGECRVTSCNRKLSKNCKMAFSLGEANGRKAIRQRQ